VDARNYIEEVEEKGKELMFYQNEEQGKQETSKRKMDF
jgi:hypothetical protein